MIFCVMGDNSIVDKMIGLGAEINVSSVLGVTALMTSIHKYHESISTKLIHFGADINAVTSSGITTLMYACQKGKESIVDILVQLGANVNASQTEGVDDFENLNLVNNISVFEVEKDNCFRVKFHDVMETSIYDSRDIDVADLLRPSCQTEAKESIKQREINEKRKADYISLFDQSQKLGNVSYMSYRKGSTSLMYACAFGSEPIVNKLLDCGADLDSSDDQGTQALMFACAFGNKKIVDKLVSRGAKVNICDKNGFTALMYACKNGHQRIVYCLLAKDAEINASDDKGGTALIYACMSGHSLIVNKLIEFVDYKDVSNNLGQTPLMLTCMTGHWVTLDKLVNKGASLDVRDGMVKTAFLHACENKRSGIALTLMNKGVNITCCDTMLKTALMYACENGLINIVIKLINQDVYLDACDVYRKTALMYACEKGQDIIVSLLIGKGVDVQAYNFLMKTVLMYACENGNRLIVQQLLLRRGMKINVFDNQRKTALIYACENGHNTVVSQLLAKDVHIHVHDVNKKTALMYACEKGHSTIVSQLLAKNIDIYALDIKKKTALMYACENGNMLVVDQVLQHDINIDATDDQRKTALIYACEKGHGAILRQLIAKNANVQAYDILMKTTLMYACENGHHGIVECLIAKGAVVSASDEKGRTALMYASMAGEISIVEKLIRFVENTDASNNLKQTPLELSCLTGHNVMLDILRDKVATLNVRDGKMKTAFLHACQNKRSGTALILMNKGVNITCCDTMLKTALMYACENGLIAIVIKLINQDVYLDACDVYRKTALMYACEKGHHVIVSLLIGKGVDVLAYDFMMKTVLMYASENGSIIIVQQLLQHGMKINVIDNQEKTALMYACEKGHTTIVSQLSLAKDIDIDARDVKKKTAFMYACENGNMLIVDQLLQHDINIDAFDDQRKTALMYACEKGQGDIVRQLIGKDANVQACDVMMKTVLMYACENGDKVIVDGLLHHDINIDAIDNHGKSAFMYARDNGHETIVNKLEKFGATFETPMEDEAIVFNDTETPVSTFTPNSNSSSLESSRMKESTAEGDEDTFDSDVLCKSREPKCINEKNHHNYIKLSDFTIDHLPAAIKNEDNFELVKMRSKLTVKIDSKFVSPNRPDQFPNRTTQYPCFRHKGKIFHFSGTGIITSILMNEPVTHMNCPCPECEESNMPKKKWWELIVTTATHVIYDKLEARNATFRCFYDNDDDDLVSEKILHGCDIHYSLTRMDSMDRSDLSEVLCIAHDEAIIKEIKPALKDTYTNSTSHEQLSGVIVSHPHGWSKRISFGTVSHLTVPISQEFKTNTATIFMKHTKCRLGSLSPSQKSKMDTQFDAVGNTNTSTTNKLIDTSHSNTKLSTSETSSLSLNHGEGSHTFENKIQSEIQLLFKEGYKNYVSIFLIPAMEAWIKALEFVIDNRKQISKYSKEDIMIHVYKSMEHIKSVVYIIKESPRKSNEMVSNLLSDYNRLKMKYKPDAFFKVQNKLFNILFPQVFELMFNQVKSCSSWRESSQHDRQNYKEEFSLIVDFYNKVFENIHPEYNVLNHYMNGNFNNLMRLTIIYMRRALFSSLTKCCPDSTVVDQESESEFMLPSGVTFTLPSKAKYAFRYHKDRPGWFKFPRGTQFALQDGTPLEQLNGAEFKNDTLYPTQCYASYDMETCTGSSGAAVYCHLLEMPFMTLFPHHKAVHKKDGNQRQSGVQTNRFCTFLANISNLIGRMKTGEEEKLPCDK